MAVFIVSKIQHGEEKKTFMISVKQRSQNTDSLFLETFVIKSFKFFDILLTT